MSLDSLVRLAHRQTGWLCLCLFLKSVSWSSSYIPQEPNNIVAVYVTFLHLTKSFIQSFEKIFNPNVTWIQSLMGRCYSFDKLRIMRPDLGLIRETEDSKPGTLCVKVDAVRRGIGKNIQICFNISSLGLRPVTKLDGSNISSKKIHLSSMLHKLFCQFKCDTSLCTYDRFIDLS